MHSPTLSTAVRRIRSLAAPLPDGIPDRDLLRRFVKSGDQSAFASLVARHGSAVLGVCRRVLNNGHDAEDAFQATFLVLARRASSIRKTAAVGCWLHGVAYRVSKKLQCRLARQPRPTTVPDVPSEPRDDVSWRDVRRVLDEEVHRLPERYRLPVLLCYFEGKTRDEAADDLGWKLTTLRGRLEDGRLRLRARLAKRGIELSAALLAISAATDGSAVSESLLHSTLQSTTGQATATVNALAKGIAMSSAIGKTSLSLGTLLLAVGLGATLLAFRGQAGDPPGSGFKAPESPAKVDPVPREVLAMFQAADRVWVVDEPTDKNPMPEPVDILKGMSPPAKDYSFQFQVEALKSLPRKGHRWIVFLKSIDEVDHRPKIDPIAGERWYIPADDKTIAALHAHVPLCEWGETSNGLRLGLLSRTADEPTVEIVLQNVGKGDLQVKQFRGNYWDDWAPLTFDITGPDGKKYSVHRIGPPLKDGDSPRERVLKAGERYIHVVRLNRWIAMSARDRGLGLDNGGAPEGLFASGGYFKVQAKYSIDQQAKVDRPWWMGQVGSKPVTVKVPKGGIFGEPAGDFRLRLRQPTGQLRLGDLPELLCDLRFSGKEKRTVFNVPDHAAVELDGRWYSCRRDGSIEGKSDELAPGSEHSAWLKVKPDLQWIHLHDKPNAEDPAIKEAVSFQLTKGTHTLRVAYTFGKTDRAISNAVTIEVASDGWGEASGGIKSRLRLSKTTFAPGEPLTFELDLKNLSKKAWTISPIPFDCSIEMDGRWYIFHGAIDYKSIPKELKPGGELVPFVTVTVDGEWRTNRHPKDPPDDRDREPKNEFLTFKLERGKHKLKVGFPIGNAAINSESNTVEIDVVAPPLSPTFKAMALDADRIWVVNAPTKEKPIPLADRVLKGPRLPESSVFDLRLLPGDDPKQKFIVFLQTEEEGKNSAVVKPLNGEQWYRPYDAAIAEEIRKALLPTDAGEEKGGLRLGLRLRKTKVAVDQSVFAEIAFQNNGTQEWQVPQHRFNIYDYWPDTYFEVTGPDGVKLELRKHTGAMDEADNPHTITLKPGEVYVHAVRLNLWPGKTDWKKASEPLANVFTKPGEYTIRARYRYSPPMATWTADFPSNEVKLSVKKVMPEPWGKESHGFLVRMRLPSTTLKAGEPFRFELDVKNTTRRPRAVTASSPLCDIDVDGKRYSYTGAFDTRAKARQLEADEEILAFMTVSANEMWVNKGAKAGEPRHLLEALRPGKHKFAAAFTVDQVTGETTQTVDVEVLKADEWGAANGGIRSRVRLAKAAFTAGEPLAFALDLKNTGVKTVEDYPIPFHSQIELDGDMYTYTAPLSYPTGLVKLEPGKEYVAHIQVKTDEWWIAKLPWTDTGGGPTPLTLKPGKHKLRVTYPLPGKEALRATSAMVEFEVVGKK